LKSRLTAALGEHEVEGSGMECIMGVMETVNTSAHTHTHTQRREGNQISKE